MQRRPAQPPRGGVVLGRRRTVTVRATDAGSATAAAAPAVKAWSMDWILRGSGSQYDLISRAGVLTGLMLLFTTVVALLFNKTKREQVLADLAKPFENNPILNNPDIAMRMQRALAWLVVVIFANWFSSFTGQTGILNLVWVALFMSQIASIGNRSKANEAAASSGDAPPPIKAGPFGIPIPSLDGTADGTGGVPYGAQLTFAKRFSEIGEPAKGMVACMLSEWGQEPNPGARDASPPENTSGQAYLTENYLCFHAMMKNKAITVPVNSIASVTPLSVSNNTMNGARVTTMDNNTYDFMAAMVFRSGDLDIYRALLTRIPSAADNAAPEPTSTGVATPPTTVSPTNTIASSSAGSPPVDVTPVQPPPPPTPPPAPAS